MFAREPFYFGNHADNLSGSPSATPGTNFTAGASSADGSAVSVLSALAFDCHYLIIGLGGIGGAVLDTACLADVLIDPAGGTSWSGLIDDLICGHSPTPAAGTIGIQCWYHFPLWIPAGASLGLQARQFSGSAQTNGRVIMFAYGPPSRPEQWSCGTKVESVGTDPANSRGTNITPGNSGAFGSWTNIGSVTAFSHMAIQFGMNGTDDIAQAIHYHFEIGYSSARLPGSPTFHTSVGTSETQTFCAPPMPIWCDIAAGTQLQARGKASGTAEVHDVAFYGVY